jgi:glycosyltransferase involved in cell wall biosynthesis
MAMAVQGRSPERARDGTGLSAPRGHVFDDLFVKRYDESLLDQRNGAGALQVLPAWVRLANEVQRRRDEYDVIVTWSERVTLSLAAIQSLASEGKPHVAMLYWFSRPSVRLPLRAFGRSIQAVVTWSSVQRSYAIETLGIPAEKLYLVKHFVDQLFWSSTPDALDAGAVQTDLICSAGSEMRDYRTLIEALRGTNLPCHIAADHVRVDRLGFARRMSTEGLARMALHNVTVGRKSPRELRELYRRSRFVVVPLEASDTDNGINVILEAMSMGKPVICSRTRGQVDVIEEGVTGIFVPVGDANALRKAMLDLWNDPKRAWEMGRAARQHILRHHTLEKFCRDVEGAVDAALEGRAAAPDGSFVVQEPA